MKIKEITIQNWRSIKNLTLSCEDLMIFIGQNNHGKSNILSAILFFFGEIKIGELDFNCESNELYVELTFENLDDFDRRQFKKYLSRTNQIKVRKSGYKHDLGFKYQGYIENPGDEWLKEENVSNYLKRENAETLPLYEYLPSEGRISKDAFNEARLRYIANHSDSLTFMYELEGTNFLGLKNVAKGIFGDIYFIPAVKSAIDEFALKGNSAFNQIYSSIIRKMSESNEEYSEAKNKLRGIFESLNKINGDGARNNTRPPEIVDFENRLDNELCAWNTHIDVEIIPPEIDDMLKVGTSVWVDDGVRTDIERKGNGLQRALIFGLIKTWSQVLQEENIATAIEEAEATRGKSNSSYFIYEEPELYLHPQAQRELYDSLCRLSTINNQIFLCTHSPSFIDINSYKSICIVKKESIEQGTFILNCTGDLFQNIEEKNMFNLAYWVNPDRSELFFAKKVILVEGQTDKSVIPYLAKTMDIFKYDYTLIDCASKDNIPLYMQVLNRFGIKYIAVYDKDHQNYKNQEGINSGDKSSKKIEESIDTRFGNTVILENDIEEEIGISEKSGKNKPYMALKTVSSEEFVISDSLKEKIKTIYT